MICSSGPTNTKNVNVVSRIVLSSNARHMMTAPVVRPQCSMHSRICRLVDGIARSATNTPAKDSAVTPNAAATPIVATSRPPIAGPHRRERLKTIDESAIACLERRSGTRSIASSASTGRLRPAGTASQNISR